MKKWTIVLTNVYPNWSTEVVHVQAENSKQAIAKVLVGERKYASIAAVFIGWHINKLEVKSE